MNVPNMLSLIRMILIIPFYFCLSSGNNTLRIAALIIFIVSSLTDYIDGYIARKYNLVTNLGKLLDPLADKILVITALIMFVDMNWLSAWILILIVFREFLITGIRSIAAADGEVIAAGQLGKWKTATQMIAIIIILYLGKESKINDYLMYIPLALTLLSGYEYVKNSRKLFKK